MRHHFSSGSFGGQRLATLSRPTVSFGLEGTNSTIIALSDRLFLAIAPDRQNLDKATIYKIGPREVLWHMGKPQPVYRRI